MEAVEINRTFDLVSLARQDTRLHREGNYYVGPCPFCGGTDRFTLKPSTSGCRWYCRMCGDGKYHTAIDYIMRRERVDFHIALGRLGRGNLGTTSMTVSSAPSQPQLTLPDSGWQSSAWQEVDEASNRLFEEGAGRIGRDYLTERGLHSGTWYAWQLGFFQIFDPRAESLRPAIVLPWFDLDATRDSITAIKYRFVDEHPHGLRYTSRRGSVPILFGLWGALPEHHTLLLVEGEINALSVWQCLPSGVTCASFGSETGARTGVIRALAARYRRVFIWGDDPSKVGELRAAFGHGARGIRSPEICGEKWDANKLLREGMIGSFITEILDVPCLGRM